jgi:nitroreductase
VDLTTVDRLLTTTRTVRRRLDLSRPVPPTVIEECLDIALQAPTAGNSQRWHFVVVTEPSTRAAIAGVYRRARAWYHAHPPAFLPETLSEEEQRSRDRMRRSGDHLAEHLHEVPVLILPCIEGRVEHATVFDQATLYGSVLPAAWSLMLALRARGLGTAWTSDHLIFESEVRALLGIPARVTQAALLAVAFFTGDDFRPAPRRPAREVTHWETWDARQ